MQEERSHQTLAERIICFLGCDCEIFPPMDDDDPVLEAMERLTLEGKRNGYLPVVLKVDETLLECFVSNVEDDRGQYSPQAARAYRESLLSQTMPDGREVLRRLLDERLEEAAEDGLNWENDQIGEISEGEPNDRLASYWNYETERTDELLLAKIPVEHPWEVFAWLPMGGWNDCPGTQELMAVAKYWYEAWGAVPAAMSHDELEYVVKEPVGEGAALELAQEQYAYCPDRVDQCEETGRIGSLADSLTKSTVWYFWWD